MKHPNLKLFSSILSIIFTVSLLQANFISVRAEDHLTDLSRPENSQESDQDQPTDPALPENRQESMQTPPPENSSASKDAARQNSKNLSKWLNICQNLGDRLHKKKFKYSNSKLASSYQKALATKRKRSNCSLYVSWCLQEYGALKKGQTFYVKKNGSLHKNFKKRRKALSFIRVNKVCSSLNLQPGDIICFKRIIHVCIYAGQDNEGKRTWYDGGKISTYKNRSGSRYKKFSARVHNYLNSRKVSYIIRIKNL